MEDCYSGCFTGVIKIDAARIYLLIKDGRLNLCAYLASNACSRFTRRVLNMSDSARR
jgi:hypothetical protein